MQINIPNIKKKWEINRYKMLQIDIKWDSPYKSGKLWKREWLIPLELRNGFFKFWKIRGYELKTQGYSVKKRNDDWFLIESQDDKEDFDKVKSETKKETSLNLQVSPLKDTTGLHSWQIPAVEKLCAIIKTIDAAIDGSDTGCGKTYCASAVARELNMDILIVCPKSVMESWRRVIIKHFHMKDRLIDIINYDKLRKGKTDSNIASYVKRRETRRKEFIWKIPKNTLIVWDESQKLKSSKTKNSETCLAAIKQGYKMLFCSATNATNPLELKTVGLALKLFKNDKQYYSWLYDHGVTRGRFGLEFTGNKEILNKLHKDIFINRGVRLRRDLIPNFPESQLIAECYDMEEEARNKINSIYTEMSNELKRLSKKIKKDSSSGLVELLRARQKTEMVKVPLFLEMIEDGLEKGMSVVVFCNFTETIHALSERLNTKCIVNGEAKYEKYRQQNIDDFQADKERVILINIQAGGAGLSLHDLNGNYPRLSLISPSYSAVLMRQATGRVWRDGAKTKSLQKIVFVANTVEEKVCDSVKYKLENLDTLNDGDLTIV